MDPEVRTAQRHARERERAIWDRVEAIGRQTRAMSAAKTEQNTERQTTSTQADRDAISVGTFNPESAPPSRAT